MGINVADTQEEAEAFLAANGWDWPQIHDPERTLARSLGADYQPEVFLFDEEGTLVGNFEGGGTESDWSALLERLP